MGILASGPSALAVVLAFTFVAPQTVLAGPIIDNDSELGVAYDYLLQRANCDGTLCGVYDQLCCSVGSACYTDTLTQAQCSATAGASDGWAYYTTTYVETDLNTITSVWSSYTATSASAAAPKTTVACQATLGETACGAICCASDQYCYQSGQCMAYGSGSSSYSAAARPTSGSGTVTSTVAVTTTQPFSAPATASNSVTAVSSGSGGGLSAGAIAGIVIGTIAGIVLLVTICFCCILRAGCDALLGIFGLGKNRRRKSVERVEVTEERYSRRGSAAGRSTHGGWFGAGRRPARVTETRKKESSGLGGIGMVGAGLAGLALVLGLKRRHDKKDEKSRASRAGTSNYSYSDYTYTDSYSGTSESSVSSDRRTRETRRTERSRR